MKVCFITGTRADYGLLKPLIDELRNDIFFEIQIIATGAHLSPEFGLTFKAIEADGLQINEKIEILLSSDSPIGISKAMGLAIISFSEAYQRLKPDLIIGLGDRFELFSALSAAVVSRIPIAHIHGGELTLGAYDDAFRHAITKMSSIHFTSTEVYRKRVIQLGENPNNVFNVGALGIDNIKNIQLLKKEELQAIIKFDLGSPYFVVTFHPVTLDEIPSENQFIELLKALDQFNSHKIIFTYPNADDTSRILIEHINKYVKENPKRSISFPSMGQINYLSALKYSDLLIGNSSSGIMEMPSLLKPTINIGHRQQGRLFPESVIQCRANIKDILDSINKALSNDFQEICRTQNPVYGIGNSAKNIKEHIKKIDYSNLIRKVFYDLPNNNEIL